MEKIRQAVTEMWVPQVWQPPGPPADRPPTRTVTTIPLQPEGLRGKNGFGFHYFIYYVIRPISMEFLPGQKLKMAYKFPPGFQYRKYIDTDLFP